MINLNPTKISAKDISKDDLERLYFHEYKSLNEIGKYFGFYDRQPIARLFKKFGIKVRSKSENALLQSKGFPSFEEVSAMMQEKSILAASKQHQISRKTLSKYAEYYGLKSNYFVNSELKNEILHERFDKSSPKEIAMELNTTVTLVKYYRNQFLNVFYDANMIKAKIEYYGYDIENQGLAKQIINDDPSLYDSILKLTDSHCLQSNKLTERLYRIIHNYESDKCEQCQYCNSQLKFYTFKLGYGNSEHKICINCNRSINGVSLISQKLFWDIYNSLNENEKVICKFSQLNSEKKVIVKEYDKNLLQQYKKLNKNFYFFDFVLEDKIIEFDGAYYHTDIEKEKAKDAFAELKGYKIMHIEELKYKENSEEILQQCISFLKQ